MGWELLAPLAKWGTILIITVFGIWAFAKHFKKDGGRDEKIEQMERGEEAQVRQSTAMRAQRTRDLLDDLHRVRDKAIRKRTAATLHDKG